MHKRFLNFYSIPHKVGRAVCKEERVLPVFYHVIFHIFVLEHLHLCPFKESVLKTHVPDVES